VQNYLDFLEELAAEYSNTPLNAADKNYAIEVIGRLESQQSLEGCTVKNPPILTANSTLAPACQVLIPDAPWRKDYIDPMLAKIPTMVAAFQQMRRGNDPVLPRDDLDYSANFLYMLNEQEPDPLLARIFDTCLTLHAEHTINASTFSAMVTASTLTDPYGVIASAVGTLAGPLHGGANEEVIDMLEQIGSVENVRPFVEKCVANKDKIMGFGHRVYKVKDPRATILQRLAEQLFENFGRDDYYDIAVELEEVVEEKLGHKGIYANVDFYSGLVYRKMGIPIDLFTPVFAIARVAGWLAHWKEQLEANRIYRPTQIYTGTHGAPYIAIEDRPPS